MDTPSIPVLAPMTLTDVRLDRRLLDPWSLTARDLRKLLRAHDTGCGSRPSDPRTCPACGYEPTRENPYCPSAAATRALAFRRPIKWRPSARPAAEASQLSLFETQEDTA
jgi:hypothetical protein